MLESDFLHVLNASAAVSMAARTSASVALAASWTALPVAGDTTVNLRSGRTSWPLMMKGTGEPSAGATADEDMVWRRGARSAQANDCEDWKGRVWWSGPVTKN